MKELADKILQFAELLYRKPWVLFLTISIFWGSWGWIRYMTHLDQDGAELKEARGAERDARKGEKEALQEKNRIQTEYIIHLERHKTDTLR